MPTSLPRDDDENERLALDEFALEESPLDDVAAADVLFEMSTVIAAHLVIALAVVVLLRLAGLTDTFPI